MAAHAHHRERLCVSVSTGAAGVVPVPVAGAIGRWQGAARHICSQWGHGEKRCQKDADRVKPVGASLHLEQRHACALAAPPLIGSRQPKCIYARRHLNGPWTRDAPASAKPYSALRRKNAGMSYSSVGTSARSGNRDFCICCSCWRHLSRMMEGISCAGLAAGVSSRRAGSSRRLV